MALACALNTSNINVDTRRTVEVNRSEILRRFPNASGSFITANEDRPVNWSDSEIAQITEYYNNTPDSEFSIDKLASRLGRSFDAVALKASRLGLTDKRTDPKTFSDAHIDNMGHPPSEESRRALSEWMEKNHPKGMLGKHHSQKTKQAISEAHKGVPIPRERVMRTLRTKVEKYGTLAPPRHKTSWRAGWVVVGEKKFYARSRWEANYAKYLQWLKSTGAISDWEHEPKTFWFEKIKRGCVSYLPDFRVIINGVEEYHEVKGWMDSASKTKIKRMAKYHPTVKLVVIDSERYKALKRTVGHMVGWS